MHKRKWQGEWQILIVITLISVIVRIAASFLLGSTVEDLPGTADQVSYHNLALRVLSGHGFSFDEPWWPATAANAPTAHWSYLYTAYLVVVYALFGPNPLAARLIQAVLVGVLQPLLAYQVGRRVFGRAVGLVSALLTALYAYFAYYTANLMTEAFYLTAILASFYFAIRMAYPEEEAHTGAGRPALAGGPAPKSRPYLLAAGLGLSLAAAVLLRQLFLLFIPFLFLWVLVGRRRLFAPLLVSGAILVASILPFTAYNYARFGRFVLLNTNAGFAFFWGNHPIYGTKFYPILPYRMGTYHDLIPPELLELDEAALDQALLGRGIQFVLDDPLRYGLLSLSRIPPYFMFWPSSDSGLISNISRVASFGLLWPFMLYGLIYSLVWRPAPVRLWPASPVVLLYTFILVYTAIHVLTWTLIRYRLPVDAILILFAGLALVQLVERVPVLRRLVHSKTDGLLREELNV